MYNENAARLIEQGYFPIPIAPGTKKPGKWVPSFNRFCDIPDWQNHKKPIDSPQPNAGIGVRCGDGLVALDYDCDEASLIISEAFEPTPVNKSGQKAWTAFYRVDFEVPNENFYDQSGRLVLQVLSKGKQTVIPPSVHKDTGEPYRWTNGRTLLDTPLNDLPLLPCDYRDRIITLGYSPNRESVEIVDPETGEITTKPDEKVSGNDDTPFSELNSVALKNLGAWVPEVGLYKLHRNPGRYAAYKAVASWRPSTTGKPLEKRDPNLSIHPKGIKDYGDGEKGYSPLDLVMAARSCSLSEAFDWLEMRVMTKQGDTEIDLEKITEAQDAPPIAPDSPEADKKKFRFRLISFQEVRPGLEPNYIVDELVPLAGLVLSWGKQKTFKSFWLLDLMLHVSMGWMYRDRAVRQGTVIYCAFEGGHGFKARIEAMRRHYQIADDVDVPLYVMPGQADLITDERALISDFRTQLGETRPSVVVLDTLNRSLKGNENTEDMTKYVRAAEAIREAFGCVVIIVHHCGYDATHSRGHTSLPAAVDAELDVVRDEKTLLMVVTVRNMRDGPEGIEVRNRAKIFPLDPDREGRPRSSIVITPDDGGDESALPEARPGRKDVATPIFVEAMRSSVANEGFDHTPDGGETVRAATLSSLKRAFGRKYVTAEDDPKKLAHVQRNALKRALEKLLGEDVVRGEKMGEEFVVWFTIKQMGGV
jgi:hypothetical protein